MAAGFILAEDALLFDRLDEQVSDSLLALIALCDADPRPDKIDVGVGVYRDAAGGTPILRAVKKAERRLWETQETKAYLGSQGDSRFTALIRSIVFGEAIAADQRIVGVQTPGGCGALRLGAELIRSANPEARIFVGQPTWPNHAPLIASAGVEMVGHPYYDRDSREILFDAMMDALKGAKAGAKRTDPGAHLLQFGVPVGAKPGIVENDPDDRCAVIGRHRPHGPSQGHQIP